LPPPQDRLTLTDVLVEVVRAADRPVTVKQLTEEVLRRQVPTRSGNVHALVADRVKELVRRGLFRRIPGQPGVVPGQPPGGAKAPGRRARPAVSEGVVVAKTPAPRAEAGRRDSQPSFQVILTGLLQKSRRPLTARELAAQARAAGYQSGSKSFP